MVEIDVDVRRRRARRRRARRPRLFGRLRRRAKGLMAHLNKIVFGVSGAGAFALAVTDTDRNYNMTHGNPYTLALFGKDFMNNVTAQRTIYLTSAPPDKIITEGVLNKYSIAGIVTYFIGWILGRFIKFKGLGILKQLGKGLTVGGMIGGLFNLYAPAQAQAPQQQVTTGGGVQQPPMKMASPVVQQPPKITIPTPQPPKSFQPPQQPKLPIVIV